MICGSQLALSWLHNQCVCLYCVLSLLGDGIRSTAKVTCNDVCFVFFVQQLGEAVVEIAVVQRMMTPNPPSRCAYCSRSAGAGTKLRRCTKCFSAGYCHQACQKNHWTTHKVGLPNHEYPRYMENFLVWRLHYPYKILYNQTYCPQQPNCKLLPDPVGCPFVVSLPKSHATYSRLARIMEAYARYSVDVFQPPVYHSSSSPSSHRGSTSSIELSGEENDSMEVSLLVFINAVHRKATGVIWMIHWSCWVSHWYLF